MSTRTMLTFCGFGLALLAALAGCSGKQTAPEPQPPSPPPPAQLANPQFRAQLHTDLGAGYYERSQMDVALEELNMAVRVEPQYAPADNVLRPRDPPLGGDPQAGQ